ncbi:Yip1 family protein [Coleofasciculus sp. FACHB-1120]|uniref:Yip1 family protein n=1 Tax=Coleofasciculus sp. FACHB-1120 TaxID=2692783 RepID=UPI00168A0FFA|nr:Yip1 family protein [Coleofasciculus sp. FACHB-1120]MBD2744642.1 YIP1 family protein [Coleofasciculus sp. FACHB-1120]
MNLFKRIPNILLHPKSEWRAIATETTSSVRLYNLYIAPLAAIAPIAAAIGWAVIGINTSSLVTSRLPLVPAIVYAGVSFLLTLLSVFLLSLIINAFAPQFSAEKNQRQALKVAAYANTPAWLAGILRVIPSFTIFAFILGLYSVYLLYLGLPIVMKCPKTKTTAYTAVSLAGAIILYVLVIGISNLLVRFPKPML